MRILVIADPHIPVPPEHYGGTERIVDILCSGLAAKGHTIDLLAAEGSKSYGGALRTHRAPGRSKLSRARRKILFQLISRKMAQGADLVLCHGRADYLWYLMKTRIPIAVHFHHPILQPDIDPLLKKRRAPLFVVGVSHDQIAHLQPVVRVRSVINAADVNALPFRAVPDDPPYFAFLSRLTANKGVHIAIDAAKAAGVRLKVAGNVSDEPGGQEYFETEVKPRLGGDIEFIGPVNDTQKAALLGGAMALLFPTQWKEPCAVAPLEALACGCPVIGWRNGSVPEVIEHGVTGFVVDTPEAMIAAIRKVLVIDRSVCRRQAEARFSPAVYVENYLRVIDELIALGRTV